MDPLPPKHRWMDEEAFSFSISFYTAVVTGILGWLTARQITRG